MSDDKIIEIQRPTNSGGIAFVVRGCAVSITPPKDRSLTINELAQIFDEAKLMAIKMHSMNLTDLLP